MVTVADVENAQKAWGEGVVAIAAAHSSEGDYVGRARLHVESLYAYDISSVLFKPTFAIEEQFRPTFEVLSHISLQKTVCALKTKVLQLKVGQKYDLRMKT